MEKNKRTKNTILLWFVISTFVLILFLCLFFFWILPDIKLISTDKVALENTYNSYSWALKKWIDFTDFKANVWAWKDTKDDLYLKYLLNSTWSGDFYNKKIMNNDTNFNFSWSLTKTALLLQKDRMKNEKKIEKINKILPMYSSDSVNLVDTWVISDFVLINKMESLFNTFELEYWNSISISDITPLGSISTWSIDSDIFQIPMKVKLSWAKSNLENFIHYLENVWSFEIVETWTWSEIYKDIKIYNDDVIKNRANWKIALYNDSTDAVDWNKIPNTDSNYDIYNNQIVNITNIKVKDEFIDDTVPDSKNIDLDVELTFYVRWLPTYKVQNFLNNFINDYRKLVIDVNAEMAKKWNNLQEVTKINDYLKTLDKDVSNIEKSIRWKKEKDSITWSYKKVLEFNNSFRNIYKVFYSLKNIK
jgi:hypothetical protein